MPRIRPLWINGALFATALAITGYLALQGALGWAVTALRQYLGGTTTVTREVDLVGRAQVAMRDGAPAETVRKMLDEVLSIDPYSVAHVYLGMLYEREGEPDRALEEYRAYLAIDPSYLPAYLHVGEILVARGELETRDTFFRDGIAYFESEVERWVPRIDPTADEEYNDKALGVYQSYREAIAVLQAEMARGG